MLNSQWDARVLNITGKPVYLELLVEMVVPVAMMSGFMRPSRVGPIDEKNARLAKRSAGDTHNISLQKSLWEHHERTKHQPCTLFIFP